MGTPLFTARVARVSRAEHESQDGGRRARLGGAHLSVLVEADRVDAPLRHAAGVAAGEAREDDTEEVAARRHGAERRQKPPVPHRPLRDPAASPPFPKERRASAPRQLVRTKKAQGVEGRVGGGRRCGIQEEAGGRRAEVGVQEPARRVEAVGSLQQPRLRFSFVS